MSKTVLARRATFTRAQWQAYILLLLGAVLLLLAWLLHPDSARYPVGVLLLGLGMLVAAIVNPARLLIASSLVTTIGLAVFLGFKGIIPSNEIFPAYIIALGVGLMAIAFFARQGYVGRGALSPSIIVLAIGIIEALLVAGRLPGGFIPFMLSLWLPGIGLLVLGILYFLGSMRR